MHIIVNNLLTNYEKQGSGPLALFLHGWGDNLKTFEPLVSQLKKDHTCITIDLPGFGASQAPGSAWGIQEYGEFLQAFVKKIDLEPELLVGHSNGGTIAMYALAHKLITSEKLLLLASAGIRSEQGIKKTAYKSVAKVGKQLTKVLPQSLQQKLRRKLYSAAGSDIFVSPLLEETFKKVVSYDVESDAKNISQPTLLIYAADDQETPSRYGTKLKSAIKNSQLKILLTGGHFIQATQSEAILNSIKEFIR